MSIMTSNFLAIVLKKPVKTIAAKKDMLIRLTDILASIRNIILTVGGLYAYYSILFIFDFTIT